MGTGHADSDFTLLADGFVSLEGPTMSADGALFFSDLRAGGIHRLSPDGRVEVVVPDRPDVGGTCLHAQGGLVATGADVSHVAAGRTRLLLSLGDLPPGRGGEAYAFNDLAADGEGSIYVGVLRRDERGNPEPGELVRVTGERACEVVYDDVHPNGVALSPDGTVLYLADTFRRRLLVFSFDEGVTPVRTGVISTEDVPGLPDGIAVDAEGCIWVAFYRGGCVARFAPDGNLRARLAMPALKPLSLCLGAGGHDDLFVVTGRSAPGAEDTGSVYRTTVGVTAAPVHPARV
ncbi:MULTISPECIES: SMP-30/gluconolactonase/LRE family protein [unclassified Pseudofrankia]|uniref:SMP-30/gluconolactonase/LRE family protein n=1 Tax=unclassified Pseudofrankia TaxID=2994372 RepID=UPI0012FF6668|nr:MULTISPECIES: SMP-30/gluconolactonase/LRE family protein [unclassified Pseudofrankia]MDT3446906.1 SMP-30/gluconolactonase/LRE family protein [Pseudofrankia sp. BMG5.37]